jgi:hypothetical protein
MAVVVPSADVVHFNMQTTITSLTTQITNAVNAGNHVLAGKLTADKAAMQAQLAASLVGAGNISGANVLANETYVAVRNVAPNG